MSIPIIAGLSALADRFDGLILDLWGVIHDGVEAYAGAREALVAIRAAGKSTLLLSNAPRRSDALVTQLDKMGIGRELYDFVLSSGEAVHLELKDRTDPFYAVLGRKLYHLGPERDRNVYDGLDYRPVPLDQADFILNTGPVELTETLADYQALLAEGVGRGLPMVCANPDHVVIRQGARIMCAGELASRYAELGGRVSTRGKPDPAIYGQVSSILGAAKDRILAVGDALHTDIRGANGAGIGAIFVTQGIHAEELGIRPGDIPDASRLDEVVARHGDRPLAALPTLYW
ncbi:putative HAD-superfamily subfamily IIA hydrolase like protein [Magnetospirillum sp. LM-5]|uniref:TIGR01459 family HAD-type hydrolase n=1 Tax=Magnetospirillum sp. LM-5 TaxID=2681466 RepID=UPI001383D996|nr:TIGR01459 family HAD-type hydrolase [Magnetospirillum sp. LM-5]CAA7619347.1 putative HAD-superfamily subfamily IIA hydrolase like protein [Magnetospirillum sp. LM-5]